MHKLLTDSPGKKMLLLGNEAIARGAIEAGLAISAAYPGTPSSEISMNFFQISKNSDLYFEYSTNEKVALEVVAASANCGLRSMAIMKHVGMNVAADLLMTLAYVGVKAGLVIVCADDPSMFSSQNEQDNRYYGKLSGLPILEPSSVAEAFDMVKYAFELSETLQEPVIFRTTTRLNHATEVVSLGEIKPVKKSGHFIKSPFEYVTVPMVSRKLHVKLLNNYQKALDITNQSEFNFITGQGKFGIVCNGVSYNYVADAIKDLQATDQIKILRIGFSHPMPCQRIQDFLQTCEKVLVVEEGEPYMEEWIKAIAQDAKLMLTIQGKKETLFSRLYEFDPGLVRRVIASYFEISYQPPTLPDLRDVPEIPQRPPNLCPGCSHRATFYAVKKASEGMETVCPSDIGCYTLGFMPPLSSGDFVICMGASTGTACGFSKSVQAKIISFIGDSTFFHSGIPGLINAVFNQHNLTLVILDNMTTAMTGHQPHPGVDMNEWGYEGYKRIDLENLIKGMGVDHVEVIKPYHIQKSIQTIRQALQYKGVSVIISRQACSLLNTSATRMKKTAYSVSDKCKNHRYCINELACPAFYLDQDKVKINPNLCTGCAVCAQICPEHAILPLKTK
ncbi:MAG: indolepyruvate ferredoxin oxidoreductase subunit alpha [Desulfobacterales bacterium]|nr:indolepyruvate ferredoxin oxidoreductase subunit alpha [Desulfobacterales bacterium]